eukprot:TRINITY_DN1437_c0_g1_i2.p1 TRINITY_DN1437_c0_g1~~TRINITY_DN1437_c0_g1_i2.p1  ORF type:complete len:220 (-),score=22.12 TRINITY_DN1437_c0_g1_i2:27-686(-)
MSTTIMFFLSIKSNTVKVTLIIDFYKLTVFDQQQFIKLYSLKPTNYLRYDIMMHDFVNDVLGMLATGLFGLALYNFDLISFLGAPSSACVYAFKHGIKAKKNVPIGIIYLAIFVLQLIPFMQWQYIWVACGYGNEDRAEGGFWNKNITYWALQTFHSYFFSLFFVEKYVRSLDIKFVWQTALFLLLAFWFVLHIGAATTFTLFLHYIGAFPKQKKDHDQ